MHCPLQVIRWINPRVKEVPQKDFHILHYANNDYCHFQPKKIQTRMTQWQKKGPEITGPDN